MHSERGLALVTGTSAGIGRALAGALLARGWQVLGVARRPVRTGEGYRHLALDLADLDSLGAVEDALADGAARLGSAPLGLVNNAAAIGQARTLERLRAAALDRTLRLDLTVPVALMGLVRRLCPEASPLRVVNVSTALAHQPLAGAVEYCAAKAGLLMAGRVLAEEIAGRPASGVLAYEPGIVDTEMQLALRSADPGEFPPARRFAQMKAEGALAAPEEVIAPMVRFLESRRPGFESSRYGQ